jgi:3-hydroxyisobutyrate dehydrogenase-like beta-hydroxyacid dehydrogenase
MAAVKSKKVGVLGLGIIGSRVAENLRSAGHEVFVWSRSARAVPNFLATPREVANVAQVIQIFVRDGEALIEAMRDMAPSLTARHLVMNHATVSPEATRLASGICVAAGAGFLDAPFTGSKNAAASGKLVYYIGGEDHLLETARPVLEASSAKILPLGAVGDATVLKIATNLVSAVIVQALTEAAALTQGAGVPLQHLLTALESNANFSTLIGMKLPTIMSGNYEPHFSLRNMLKDAEFARKIAVTQGSVLPALDVTAAAMTRALQEGKGDLDFSVMAESLVKSLTAGKS